MATTEQAGEQMLIPVCRDACAERRDVRVTRAQTSTGLYPQVVMEEQKDRSRQWNGGRTSACEKY